MDESLVRQAIRDISKVVSEARRHKTDWGDWDADEALVDIENILHKFQYAEAKAKLLACYDAAAALERTAELTTTRKLPSGWVEIAPGMYVAGRDENAKLAEWMKQNGNNGGRTAGDG